MRTELKDMLMIDQLLLDHQNGATDTRKRLIEYIPSLHDRIAEFDMVNDLVVTHITRCYEK